MGSVQSGTMPKNLNTFLREAAASLRDLAQCAPDVANELRRFADDLEQQAEQAERNRRPQRDNAAE
jgi:ABC-type transporter Mla subunit MlaD